MCPPSLHYKKGIAAGLTGVKLMIVTIDISCLGGVFVKNTSLETKFPSSFGSENLSSIDWYHDVFI
jgi:hypothetical protein